MKHTSTTIKKIQKRVGATPDGILGPNTNRAIVKYFLATWKVDPEDTPEVPPQASQEGLDERSKENLVGVNPALVSVFVEARRRSGKTYVVIEGVRSQKRQEQLVRDGKSWTLNSYHRTGDAIDVVLIENGKVDWSDIKPFDDFAKLMYEVAEEMNVPLKWGGEWKTRDRPHFQTTRRA